MAEGFRPKFTRIVCGCPSNRTIANSAWHLKMPLNADNDDVHREFSYQLLAGKLQVNIDALFTSEHYGEGFAQYLSCANKGFGTDIQHVCVDINRTFVPVSGTAIRESKCLHEDKTSLKVSADYQTQEVSFVGAESTGKSTLSFMLAKQFNEPLVSEYGRTLWEKIMVCSLKLILLLFAKFKQSKKLTHNV